MIRPLALAAALALAQAPAHACAITTFASPYWEKPSAKPGEVALEVEYIGRSPVAPKVLPGTFGTDVPAAHRFRVKSVAAGSFAGAEVVIVEIPVCHYLQPQTKRFTRNHLIGRVTTQTHAGAPILEARTGEAGE